MDADQNDELEATGADDHAPGNGVRTVGSEEEGRRRRWADRYPPLLSMAGAIIIALAVLPSTLNLPQTPPTETLEYAPIPPEDEDTPPDDSANLESLGLGDSSSFEGDGAPGGEGDGFLEVTPPSRSENPSTKRCVEGRQTEDPLSPPCVAFFDGDNFGDTYQGVTAEEVQVVLYFDGNVNDLNTSRGVEERPLRTCVDLGNPDDHDPDENVWIRMARGWQLYFNDRYQTYDRLVRLHVCFGGTDDSPSARRAEAAEHFRAIKPFSTVIFASFGGGTDAYLDSMANRGVLNFGSFQGQEQRFFERHPGLIWGFPPSLEIQAEMYANWLCEKVGSFPVDSSDQYMGQPRKFGLVYTTDPGFESLRRFKDQVKRRLDQCGVEIAVERTYPRSGYAVDNSQTPQYALENMLAFQQADVTTILWPGGVETKMSQAADEIGYYPEWMLAGDGDLDAEGPAEYQNQRAWANAVMMSSQTLRPETELQVCFQAYRSIDPQAPRQDVGAVACDMYADLRQLFIGIQVAGPRLGPTNLEEGFRAIPPVASADVRVPACFYVPGDYTCVKDAVWGRYDPAATENNKSRPGCFRLANDGQRFLWEPGKDMFPDGNVLAQWTPTSRCLGWNGNGSRIDPNPPDPGV